MLSAIYIYIMVIYDICTNITGWFCSGKCDHPLQRTRRRQTRSAEMEWPPSSCGKKQKTRKNMVIEWGKCGKAIIYNHLVGGFNLPLWKIWVRQLGWWHSQYMESHKAHVPNHQPDHPIESMEKLVIWCGKVAFYISFGNRYVIRIQQNLLGILTTRVLWNNQDPLEMGLFHHAKLGMERMEPPLAGPVAFYHWSSKHGDLNIFEPATCVELIRWCRKGQLDTVGSYLGKLLVDISGAGWGWVNMQIYAVKQCRTGRLRILLAESR